MSIRIKRSSGDTAPATLVSGQLAYVEGSTNGGTLYIGEIGGTVRPIGGRKDHDKLGGIEAGAQVNTIDTVAGQTGTVVITTSDLADFDTAADTRIGLANINDLADVNAVTPANGAQLTWQSSTDTWIAGAPGTGVTTFVQLDDVPSVYTSSANFFVRVNGTENALEFVQDVDDGTF
jgi:hypothetical protein